MDVPQARRKKEANPIKLGKILYVDDLPSARRIKKQLSGEKSVTADWKSG